MERSWYELHPERYSEELTAFEERNISYEIDEHLKAQRLIRIFLKIQGSNPLFNFPDKTITYHFTVIYPDLYPWFRPEVYAYDLNLARHLQLRTKVLCLLPRGTEHWDPAELVATLLESQINLVLEKGMVTDGEKIKADATEQAEPVSDYYFTIVNAPVLFDPSNLKLDYIPEQFRQIGKIQVGIPKELFPARMAVLKTTIMKSGNVQELPKDIERLFAFRKVEGILVEAPEPPPFAKNAHEIISWLKQGLPFNERNIPFRNEIVKLTNGAVRSITGIRFPEEVEKGKKGTGWIFLIEGKAELKEGQKIGQSQKEVAYLAKPAYISTDAKRDRAPRLLPLTDKTVAITGLGALGSFVAVELARAGIKRLQLLDFDIVDPPTTVRWPLGISAAGVLKTEALQNFLAENYPFTEVVTFSKKIGSTRIEGNEHEVFDPEPNDQLLNSLLADTDLLLDATAEEGVNNFLSRRCIRKKLPHVVIYATPGAWGGVVMRWLPETTEGCWNCMKHWQNDNEDLVPPVDDQGLVQPPGCADITFTGSSFDLQNISLAAVRMVVSILCSKADSGYPLLQWDWAVLRLVDSDRNPIPPTWNEQKLKRHPNCNYCAKEADRNKT